MKIVFIIMALIGIALFLILLVLVQRGRGGGLAGALGGAGGQSAFGAAGAGIATTDEGKTAVPPATGEGPEKSAKKKAPPSESGLPSDTNPASGNDAGSDDSSGGK
jgi:preprotein translocase subunit SecG